MSATGDAGGAASAAASTRDSEVYVSEGDYLQADDEDDLTENEDSKAEGVFVSTVASGFDPCGLTRWMDPGTDTPCLLITDYTHRVRLFNLTNSE